MSLVKMEAGASSPLDTAPVGSRQVTVLLAAMLLATLDGFDASSMAFVAPAISAQWHVEKAALGLLLSSGLVGMAIGSLLLSPVADAVGRKPVILANLVLMTAGALFSALAQSVWTLAASRVVTGIGIGVMIVMTMLIATEFTSSRRRALAVAAVTTFGFPLGNIVGGLTASVFLRTVGWHWVFLTGALIGSALFILVALVVPESPGFLISRRPPDALAKLNKVLAFLRHPALSELPPAPDRRRVRYRDVFGPSTMGRTSRLMAVMVLVTMAVYYLVSWLPQLVADSGFPAATGSLISAISGLVALTGGVSLGALSARFAPARLTALAMVGLTLAIVAFGWTPPVLALWILTACVFGFFVSASTGTFYGIVTGSYSPAMRASGTGLVLGVGRIASAIGPAVAGWMFAFGLTRAEVSMVFGLGTLAAAVLISGMPSYNAGLEPSQAR